ncbi:hypothetical protein BD324DRAFT_649012 [Kockovaella imperatae]|uniref:Uncharacterized protein n=1 Tax=Kockovaella imperatae TaxID=4999 RepID=A0A1Y1ULI3_9TREE|nr:hypothetical protein BD324DRAFT_649012 [Kockovaella imperatae]ORX38913.1 hypothetical protein BD324DRAFT_649012 [Kockovaella imperatae]
MSSVFDDFSSGSAQAAPSRSSTSNSASLDPLLLTPPTDQLGESWWSISSGSSHLRRSEPDFSFHPGDFGGYDDTTCGLVTPITANQSAVDELTPTATHHVPQDDTDVPISSSPLTRCPAVPLGLYLEALSGTDARSDTSESTTFDDTGAIFMKTRTEFRAKWAKIHPVDLARMGDSEAINMRESQGPRIYEVDAKGQQAPTGPDGVDDDEFYLNGPPLRTWQIRAPVAKQIRVDGKAETVYENSTVAIYALDRVFLPSTECLCGSPKMLPVEFDEQEPMTVPPVNSADWWSIDLSSPCLPEIGPLSTGEEIPDDISIFDLDEEFAIGNEDKDKLVIAAMQTREDDAKSMFAAVRDKKGKVEDALKVRGQREPQLHSEGLDPPFPVWWVRKTWSDVKEVCKLVYNA